MRLAVFVLLVVVLACTFAGSQARKRKQAPKDLVASPRMRRSAKSKSSKSPKSGKSSKSPKSSKSGKSSKNPKSSKSGKSSKSPKSSKSGKSTKSSRSGKSSKSPKSPASPESVGSYSPPFNNDKQTDTTKPAATTTTTTSPHTTTREQVIVTELPPAKPEFNSCLKKPLVNRKSCSLPVAAGNCRGAETRFYYNSDKRRCLPFKYGGCDGNDNNFETLESCEDACPHAMCHFGGCNPTRMHCSGRLSFCIASKDCYICKCSE